MEKMDSRVRYTKMVLKQALLEILQTKPIGKVTIKEICEEANLNRGTFYLHYNEPNDLLREIENEFVEENMNFFSPYIQEQNDINHLANLFNCILSNRDICIILMGPHGAPQFLDRIQSMMRDNVLGQWQAEFPEYDHQDLEFVYEFILPGAMRLILNWAQNKDNISTEHLAKRLDRLGHYCHLAIKEFY